MNSGFNYVLCLFCSIISLPELKLNIDASSIKALRAGRVLRPLKLVSGIPSRSMIEPSLRQHHTSSSSPRRHGGHSIVTTILCSVGD